MSIKANSLVLWIQAVFSVVFSPMVYGLFCLIDKRHIYEYSPFFIVIVIGITFIINMSYLMIRERMNMKYMYINYPIRHYINEYVLKGINILIRLISMTSILEIVFTRVHIKFQLWFTFIIMPIIMFIFVFILGDITFNEFIYARNHFILRNHSYIQNAENTTTIFPKSIELIWNTTRDKFSRMSSITKITNLGGVHRMLPYSTQIKHIMNKLKCGDCSDTKINQRPAFENFYKDLISLSKKEHVSKKQMTHLAMKWDRINWLDVKKDLDRHHNQLTNENLNELIYFLNYYKTKISDIFML